MVTRHMARAQLLWKTRSRLSRGSVMLQLSLPCRRVCSTNALYSLPFSLFSMCLFAKTSLRSVSLKNGTGGLSPRLLIMGFPSLKIPQVVDLWDCQSHQSFRFLEFSWSILSQSMSCFVFFIYSIVLRAFLFAFNA